MVKVDGQKSASSEAQLLYSEFCAAPSNFGDEFRLGSLASILAKDCGISVILRNATDLLNLSEKQAHIARRILSRAPSGRPDPSIVLRLVAKESK